MRKTFTRLIAWSTGRSIFRTVLPTCCILAFLIPQQLPAQESAAMQGKITDARTGDPLPGANVFIRELTLGSATDKDGMYTFLVPAAMVRGQEVTLVVKFVGYRQKTQKFTLSAQVHTLDFVLTEDVLGLEEVVVTGTIGGTFKERLPFTVDRITKTDLEHVPAVTAESAIRGKVAGAKVVQGSGQPGEAAVVQLRGPGSITGTNEPLYIVDGVILGESTADIDALNIQSVEVVKGPAAASLYGSRAGNGVVQITTSRGEYLPDNTTRITLRNEYGVNQLQKKIGLSQYHHFLVNGNGDWVDKNGNVVQRKDRVMDVAFNGQAFKDNPYKGPLYDQVDEFFDPGFFYTNLLSVAHKSASTNFSLSLINERTSGILEGNDGYKSQKGRLNVDHSFSNNLRFSVSGFHSSSEQEDIGGNPFFSLTFMPPDVNLRAPNEDGEPFVVQPDPNSLEDNPLYALNNTDLRDRRKRTMGSLDVRYALLSWFELESNVSYDRLDFHETNYYHKGFKTVEPSARNNGEILRRTFISEALNGSVTGSVTYDFGDLSTRSKVRYLFESDNNAGHIGSGNSFATKDVPSLSLVTEGKDVSSSVEDIKSEGYFFITGLDYQGKYILDGLVRRDGSSLFGPKDRWHTYYRGSAAYRISEEPWWPFEDINEFKLRYSYGTAGGRPSFNAQYEVFNVASGVISKQTLGNKSLRPEFHIEQEFGVELGLWDRILFELTYAKSVNKDQLLQVPLAGYYGYESQWQNAGTLESNTLEASLKAFILQKRDMSWSAELLFDRTRQRITEFNLPAYKWGYGNAFYNRKGEDFGVFYGDRWMTGMNELDSYSAGALSQYRNQFQVNDDGYLVFVGQGNSWKDGSSKQLWGTKSTLTGSDGKTYSLKWGLPLVYVDATGDKFHRIGSVVPDFNLALSSTFRWRGFTAYVLFDAQIGGDVYNRTRQWGMRELAIAEADQFGKPEENKKPVDYYNTLYDVNAVNSYYVEDASYLKLRELSIRYTFDRAALQPWVGNLFNRVTVGVIGRNVFTVTDYTGYDPEVGRASVNERADAYTYPNYRNITGLFEIEF